MKEILFEYIGDGPETRPRWSHKVDDAKAKEIREQLADPNAVIEIHSDGDTFTYLIPARAVAQVRVDRVWDFDDEGPGGDA